MYIDLVFCYLVKFTCFHDLFYRLVRICCVHNLITYINSLLLSLQFVCFLLIQLALLYQLACLCNAWVQVVRLGLLPLFPEWKALKVVTARGFCRCHLLGGRSPLLSVLLRDLILTGWWIPLNAFSASIEMNTEGYFFTLLI